MHKRNLKRTFVYTKTKSPEQGVKVCIKIMENTIFLTAENAKQFEGKTVTWKGYGNYEGVALINKVDTSKRNPLECTIISGDNLNYAFNEYFGHSTLQYKADICFSDGDRFVTIIDFK